MSARCRFAVASMSAPSSPNHVVKGSCDSALMSDIAWPEVLSDMLFVVSELWAIRQLPLRTSECRFCGT